ncbi:DUF1217 domain-containing protein [Aquabacter cavernae]|uniref:DUF1217 domain-containing protein n=1 Tax=Aquabacter cavernae TaxID=2496029 RepID=UPI000F8CF2B7|nr:DUF1217 domain-containing protein [Aquabacter cavernae]
MDSTFSTYTLISKNLTRTLEMTQKEPVVARETKYYEENIGNIKSIDDFVGDTRIFNYAMKAFGLEDMAYAKAFMRKALEGGVEDKKSFANRLNDDRFVQFVTTFNFAAKGEAVTASSDVKKPVVDKYVRQTLEVTEGADNEAVRLALYFQRAAPDVKSVYGLLADAALTEVVKTVFNLPTEMSSADIDRQAKTIEKLLDVADLQDPAKLDKLIKRFAVMYDAQNFVATSPILQLFADNGYATSLDLSMTIMNLKHGG